MVYNTKRTKFEESAARKNSLRKLFFNIKRTAP